MIGVNAIISYAELVDLLRVHLRDGESGLITGISEQQHSFQIGFENGKIVFLSYRVLKSVAALEKLLMVDTAKVVEHLGVPPPAMQQDLPDTGTIIARLGMGKAAAGIGGASSVNANISPPSAPASSPSSVDANTVSATKQPAVSITQLDAIKKSAVHTFGPFAAVMCDQYLTPSNLAKTDLRTLLTKIAQDLGASNTDIQTFVGQNTP